MAALTRMALAKRAAQDSGQGLVAGVKQIAGLEQRATQTDNGNGTLTKM